MIAQRNSPILGQPWSEQGYLVLVPAGAGVLAVAPSVLVSKNIPSGARVWIDRMSIRIVDEGAYDQMIFAVRRNAALIAPWEKISGEQIREDFIVRVESEFGPGLFEIIASNISGTTQPGASLDQFGIRAIARFSGSLMSSK